MSEKIYTVGLYRKMVNGGAQFLCEDGELLTLKEAEKGTVRRNKACPYIKPMDAEWITFEAPVGKHFYMFTENGTHGDVD